MRSQLLVRLLVLLSAITVFSPAVASAQVRSVRDEARRATASRAELEAFASEAEMIASQPGVSAQARRDKLAEASAIRQRLSGGDFQVGDRIFLRITGDPSAPPQDTVTVRTGAVIQVNQQIGEISLRGVLRSELGPHMQREISRFIRGVTVQAVPVVRLGVFGPVGRPGFYDFSSEVLISEAIMKAGGPMQTADTHNMTIRRGTTETWSRQAVDIALQEGISIEQLGLRNGDEMQIGDNSSNRWQVLLQVMQISLQVVSIVLITRRNF
jgi:protein involved in polysaccharide export with SLBB domain